MNTSFESLQAAFRDAVEGFLWDQWVSIGLAGVARRRFVPFVIDPEALLLATTRFANHDARFMGEVLDWIDHHGRLLSLQRIKNLHSNPGIGSLSVLMAITERVSRSRQKQWKTLLALGAKETPRSEPPVFAPDLELRGMSVAPDPTDGEAFLFRMRSLFGVNARAEILTWLLAHRSGHPARIARETGWFSKSVQAILNDLEASGLVHATPRERQKHFRLSPEPWKALLHPAGAEGEIRWFTQSPFYRACDHLDATLGILAANGDKSEGLQSVVIRERLVDTQTALESAGQGEWFDGYQALAGERMIEHFRNGVRKAIRVLSEEREWLGR